MNIDMITGAADRLAGHARITPLLNAPLLDKAFGKRIYLKAECLQLTGSFKFRGAWAAVSTLPAGTKGVLAYSSGNHGQGVALAATQHGMQAIVVMPSDAPLVKINNTKAYGAEVVLYNRTTEDRDSIGAALCAKHSLALIKPFDDAQVIAGQGTVGLEIAAQSTSINLHDAEVLVCCGGGGLASGIALALDAKAPGLRVRTVEPVGFDDMARSLASGVRQRNAATTGSICDAILTPTPGELTFPILQRLTGPGHSVSDEEARHAMALAFTHFRLVLEPGGAVALAAALFRPTSEAVICTASGGNVDPSVFANALKDYA